MLNKYFKGSNSLEQANVLREPKNEVAKLFTKPYNYSLNWLAPAALQDFFFYNSVSLIEFENVP